jgi:hypothetical protein
MPNVIANGVRAVLNPCRRCRGSAQGVRLGDTDADYTARSRYAARRRACKQKRLVKRSTGIGAYDTGLQIELGMGSSANCDSSETVP